MSHTFSRVNGRRYSLEFPAGADHIYSIVRKHGWYEKRMLEDIREHSEPGSLALDVGAYVGTHTVWMAGVCNMRVLAFEPARLPFKALGRNIAANRLEGLATPLRAALGAAEGFGRVEVLNEANTGMSVVRPASSGILITTIDSLSVSPALIKIDVEGTELEVLVGALGTLERCHPRLYVEAPDTVYQVAELLNGFGYAMFGQFNSTPTYGFSYGS
jgi:FkbM family methyltransferase